MVNSNYFAMVSPAGPQRSVETRPQVARPGPALRAAWGCTGPLLALLSPPKASRPRQGAQDLPSTAEGPMEVLLYFQ